MKVPVNAAWWQAGDTPTHINYRGGYKTVPPVDAHRLFCAGILIRLENIWRNRYCCRLGRTALTLALLAQRGVKSFRCIWRLTDVLQSKCCWNAAVYCAWELMSLFLLHCIWLELLMCFPLFGTSRHTANQNTPSIWHYGRSAVLLQFCASLPSRS